MCVFFRVFPLRCVCFLHARHRERSAVASSYACGATRVPILCGIRRSNLDNAPLMNPLARRILAASPLALAAACSTTPPPGAAANGEPMIYVSSTHSASSIASCLKGRLPQIHESRDGNATELSVGSRSNESYHVTLTPSGYGSTIRVIHGNSRSDDPPEPELRFDVARCAT